MYFRHLWYLDPTMPAPSAPFSEGIKATAISTYRMGTNYEEATTRLVRLWTLMGRPEGVFTQAAEAITQGPLPEVEDVHTTRRRRPLRRLLGLREPVDHVLALLNARETLQHLAARYDQVGDVTG